MQLVATILGQPALWPPAAAERAELAYAARAIPVEPCPGTRANGAEAGA